MTILSAFLLAVFAASCCVLIADGFRHRSGILQFPFLAGGAMAGFLLPQAIGIVRNPGMVPEAGLNKALIMCTLCTLATYHGWRRPIPSAWRGPSTRYYSNGGVYAVGLVLLGVGLYGYLKLTALSGGIAAHYSTSGSYALTWTGLPVVYSFIASYLAPALVFCCLTAIKRRSILRLIPAGIVVAIQLATIIFLGRRSDTVSLFLSVACILYFARGWLPPRLLVYALMPLAAAGMFLAPAYRTHSEFEADRSALKNIDATATVESVFAGQRAEFWSLCYIVQITDDSALYHYGAGFYNELIFMFVPKLIVGEEGKAALVIPVQYPYHIANNYEWVIPYGMVPTGPGVAYEEFWFFGAALFYLLSRFLKYLWIRATEGGDLVSQGMYALTVTYAMSSLTNDLFAIYGPIFMFCLPILLITRSRLLSVPLPVRQARA